MLMMALEVCLDCRKLVSSWAKLRIMCGSHLLQQQTTHHCWNGLTECTVHGRAAVLSFDFTCVRPGQQDRTLVVRNLQMIPFAVCSVSTSLLDHHLKTMRYRSRGARCS